MSMTKTSDIEMTQKEWSVAWKLWDDLGQKDLCAASCGCEKDPIVIIVRAFREAKRNEDGRP